MDNVLLKIEKTNKLEIYKNTDAVNKLYYELIKLPSQEEIDDYNKKHNTHFELNKLKQTISETNTAIPLFDIVSQNIYLISSLHVFEYVKEKHYRIATEKIYNFLKDNYKKTKSLKLKHVIEKNVNFLENYNFDILFITYLKVIYTNSNQVGKNITDCKRISFLPYLTNIDSSPYYSRSEIINMALNLKLINPDMTFYDNDKLNNLCLDLSKYDISSKTILEHQLYIEKNNAQHIIYYYTFYGSQYYNKYLRNTSNIQDDIMENNIKKLNSLIRKSPEFSTDVYVYRFINSDSYLEHLRINSIFKETSFISTTRNPFYKEKENVFGNILLKIKLPKNKQGIGLCVESYSLFPNEQEIILAPGSLKLLKTSESNSNDDFTYFHTDINAQKSIYKKYEFEYIETLDDIIINNYKKESIIFELPQNFELISGDPYEKIIEFYRSVPIINEMHYFNFKKYMFQVFYLNKGIAYQKYYYLLKNNPENQEIIFLVLQDSKTQEINLIIEISDIISVNYLHRYTGANTLDDQELMDILTEIVRLFKINNVIIHPIFKKYKNSISNVSDVLDNMNEYQEKDILLNFSADISMYNVDVMNYLLNNKSARFINIDKVINKLEVHFLDRLKRLSPELILKIEDTDELYRLYNKNKFTNISNMLLYLHENYFYLLPLFINKISSVLKINPFLIGYYVLVVNNNVYIPSEPSKLEKNSKVVNIRT
jgi:hypothetical protein